jgi:D-xylose transport system permease protein
VLASRLRSIDTNSGGGTILLYSIAAPVIGGTSLFGGRGHIKSAVLGALVIASIDNGLGLLGLSAGTKFVITGLVLLAAVTVDSFSRRSRAQAGRA